MTRMVNGLVLQKKMQRLWDERGESTPNGCVTANNFIAYHTNQLTPLELEDIRNKYGMSQVEMSKLIGVGDSVYGRWERGSLTPSRAMCNYLRILKKFPEAFEWLMIDDESVNV